jgi:mannose/fructose/sorbose-specific phosphotransferase system IIA component
MRAFRIVVAAHGDLAEAFVSAASLICGQIEGLHAVGLRPEDSPETFQERLREACGPDDEPLLILTDLVGGTPHNVAMTVVRRRPSAVLISGVNLAVVIEAATSTDALDAPSQERLVALGRTALAGAASLLASRST